MKQLLLLFCYLLFNGLINAQSPKKETLSFYKSIIKLDTNEIKDGKHLELARTFSIEEFVNYHLTNGKNQNTIKYGLVKILPIKKDSISTYFVKSYVYGVLDFFKVNTKDLNDIAYEGLNGDTLRKKFINEIVPEADKKKVERRSKGQMMFFENPVFTYSYIRNTKRILVKYRWKLNGDLGIRIINKTYTAEYDIASKQFINGPQNVTNK